tara:strand:+ start:607 stop:1023 length:417 start_codon:yes stop_codon:yes gene_type:complete
MKIFDWLNQVLVQKKSWESFSDSEHKTFSPFMINRFLSMDTDFIEIVNYFQEYAIGTLEPREVYKWYCDVLPKGKRFNKYIKGKKSSYSKDLIDMLKIHFEVSSREITEYIELVDKEEITELLKKYGKNKKQIKGIMK